MGNRQLLGVFFIVVVLLGVFFTMGYILGRNSSPGDSSPLETAAVKKGDAANPLVVDSPSPAARTPAESKPPEPKPEVREPEPKPPETKAAPAKAEPAPPKQEKKAEPPAPKPAAAPPKPATTPQPAAAGEANTPPAGTTFLQVAAVKKPEAQLIVKVLSDKGFSAWVAPGPNDTVFRVLVGPVKDAAAVAKTRTDLEAAGFKPIVRRY